LLSQVPAQPLGSAALLTDTQALLLHAWQAPGQSLRWVQPTQVFVVRLQVAVAPPHWLFFVHCTQAPVLVLQAVAERPAHSLSAVHLVH
jgi:hypothetical protein